MKNLYAKIIFTLLMCLSSNAQVLHGFIYDEDEACLAVKITNTTRNITTTSNMYGAFSIPASINDTLQFESYLHEDKKIEVSRRHLIDDLIIELKKTIHELQVVYLEHNFTPEFDVDEYNYKLQEQIQNDIKNNPHYYYRFDEGFGQIDLFSFLTNGLMNLFGYNHSPIEKNDLLDTYDFELLFITHDFFNDVLLLNDLNITQDNRFLFFDFLESKKLEYQYFDDIRILDLLEIILETAAEFNTLVAEYELIKDQPDNPYRF